MQLTTEAWIWLAASPVAAVIVDLLITRALLEALRPTSAYVFWAGRVGKLAAFYGWLGFLTGFWYPRFVSADDPPEWMRPAALILGVLLLAAAIATKPRAPHRGSIDA